MNRLYRISFMTVCMLVFYTFCLPPAFGARVCSWNNPGVNPYGGGVPEAIDNYKDIPKETRERLKARMVDHRYDEIALITRNGIEGDNHSYSNLRGMHFGAGKMCDEVDRSGWRDHTKEAGLVYCEDNYCILVPTVCRNVSRIDKVGTAVATTTYIPALVPNEQVIIGEPQKPITYPYRVGDYIVVAPGVIIGPDDSDKVQKVDEPGTVWLLAIAFVALYLCRHKRR